MLSFDADFVLVPADPTAGTPALVAPEGSRRDTFLQWVATLPDSQPPTWLGLPSNAEMVLLTTVARNLAADMLKLLVRDGLFYFIFILASTTCCRFLHFESCRDLILSEHR